MSLGATRRPSALTSSGRGRGRGLWRGCQSCLHGHRPRDGRDHRGGSGDHPGQRPPFHGKEVLENVLVLENDPTLTGHRPLLVACAGAPRSQSILCVLPSYRVGT